MRRPLALSLAFTLLLGTLAAATPAAAQSSTACPIIDNATVSQVLGAPVKGSAEVGLAPGFDFCDFLDPAGTDFGVSRQSDAFAAGDQVGYAGLAQRYVPGLPDEARAQIDALRQAGIPVVVPGYQLAPVSGVGDAALWVKSELLPGFFKDSLLVQRGTSAFAFDTDDTPEAQAQLTALALAVLNTLA